VLDLAEPWRLASMNASTVSPPFAGDASSRVMIASTSDRRFRALAIAGASGSVGTSATRC